MAKDAKAQSTRAITVDLPFEGLNEVLAKATEKAVEEAIGGWQTKTAMSELIAKAVSTEAVVQAVEAAADQIDWSVVSKMAVDQMQGAVERWWLRLIVDGMAHALYRVQHGGVFHPERKQEELLAELRQELMLGVKRQPTVAIWIDKTLYNRVVPDNPDGVMTGKEIREIPATPISAEEFDLFVRETRIEDDDQVQIVDDVRFRTAKTEPPEVDLGD